MDIIETGYRYRVYDLKGGNPQDITFIRRTRDGGFDPGTTNEELVDVLIARMYTLQIDNPSAENQCIVIMLKAIRQILNRIVGKSVKKKNKLYGTKKNSGTVQREQPPVPIYGVNEQTEDPG